ncbi:ribosomal protein L18e/L15P [Amylocarpus encephaloides]|uniref:Ribosomal protein L18e/L15P n=1 Tax=Amylocarpus encephaloides TaxID=45428 RepID=A0A9P7YPT5_9HELO|nr:ribosomal protein L18e/L15P [Amylocarpus encephaloides]
MPPRLPALATLCRAAAPTSSPLLSFLLPSTQARHASILGDLRDVPSAYNKRIRRGRGPSSGKGKTSGRGHKGQKQHGKVPVRFQGGQTPQDIVKGVRGFENLFSVEMSKVNLNRIQDWIDQGRLDPTKPITVKELAESRCLHGVKDGVKVLARGKEDLKTPINLLVSRASVAAIEAIEAAGGTVTTRYYTKQSIKRLLKSESESSFTPLSQTFSKAEAASLTGSAGAAMPFTYRLPDPTSRKDLEYYRDPAHRGYLSHMLGKGQGPSLFFKAPGLGVKKRVKKVGADQAAEKNRLW